ncbi:allophanate hydrolase [Nocardia stercoris]|uniref:allophanate hydrolase n=1 Tax=Nocardia stercoris TaxID=2483361 RepID=UPI0018F54AD4|nr:allophanate hydrolase [Nocardia stercoris]
MTIWIEQRDPAEVEADIASAHGPLAGLRLAVKDNVDVAGIPTTAGCPGYAYLPERDAAAVAAMRAAGAVVVGKTNLDQFATGLVGTRSPYGAVPDTRRPEFVGGGSSSGSAAAVACGAADIAISTDTAGSGRVPAAYQGLVGIKPTVGVISTAGVVPACRSYDCVTVFARDLDTANRAMGVLAAGAPDRAWPADVRLAAPPKPTVAVFDSLPRCGTAELAAFERTVNELRAQGVSIVTIDPEPFLAAARLLYDGALVAERYAAVGEFVDAHPHLVDPTVGAIIAGARDLPAHRLVSDLEQLDRLRTAAMAALAGADALLAPTTPGQPTIDEVAADPVGVNSWVGTYTNFCNLFDLCAVAVPAGLAGAAQFGVTVFARPFEDAVALDIAARIPSAPIDPHPSPGRGPLAAAPAIHPQPSPAADPQLSTEADPQPSDSSDPQHAVTGPRGFTGTDPAWPLWVAPTTDLIVFGAHLYDQPLMFQLTDLGARWAGPVRTSPAYRLAALDTVPPKPAVTRTPEGTPGISVAAERWILSPAALGRFLTSLPSPMQLGAVELDDGTWHPGFSCTGAAAAAARDLTPHTSWRTALPHLMSNSD